MGAAKEERPGRWQRPVDAAPEPLGRRDLFKAAGLLAGAALLLVFFREIFELALAFYAAVVLAVTWNPLLERSPLPRWLSAVLAAVLTLAALGTLLYFLSGPLLDQLEDLRAALPEMVLFLRELVEPAAQALGVDLDRLLGEGEGGGEWVAELIGGLTFYAFLAFVIFLGSVYLMARPHKQLLEPALRLFRSEQRRAVRGMMFALAPQLRRFVLAEAISITLVSTLATLYLGLLGVPYPLALGVIMGLGELVPYLGPVFTVIPALIVAFMEAPILALWVLLGWGVLQAVQSQIVWPLLIAGTIRLHPVWVVFGVIVFGRLFGPLGVLLAVPLISLLGILIQTVLVDRKLGTAHDRIEPLTG